MNAKIYMTACMKGGCAKTVTTYNLAYSLQKLGKKVLAVDFDSQANLTTCFGVEEPAAISVTIAIVGTITGNWIGMFSFLLPFTILRQYAGGIHLEKPMNCIIFSGFLVFGCGQYLAVASDIGKILCALWVAAILLIFVLAPIDTKGKKLDKTAKKIYGRRARGVLVIEVMIAICFWVCGFIVVTKGIAIAHIILMVSLITGKANFFDYR